ncbi:Heavy metal-associated isoprenylated plant protein 7 [Mucuna pruriens]|uniref:Heavy metal-associated isoprenylated plant protein 7 n=1 Tax=Mucuna pruriens TaxID=157652 RepID=A0A371E9D2_MUCPR|nr:Heavy metal-associated isoprenylated plant protein 7 [Mucuna pruriens]
MGEEEKKPEEPKAEEPKKAEEAAEEKKPDELSKESKAEEAAPPPPPPEIVLQVFMHCEGCARKVRRSLKGFPGVEDVVTDCKSHKVVVKGEKADPLKVLERIQRKSHRQVELLSPIPKPPEEKKVQEEEKPKPEEKKKEQPPIVTVLKVHMHCEACSQEIKRRIQRMKGVESAEPDLKSSQVSVKGVYDPAKLVEYVYKRTGKQAVIVKQEAEKKEKVEEAAKEEKKEEEGEKEKKSGEGEEKKEKEKEKEKEEEEANGEAKAEEAPAPTEDTNKVVPELKINEYYYIPPRYGMEVYAYPGHPTHPAYYQSYPPQMFSDENPNACTVM